MNAFMRVLPKNPKIRTYGRSAIQNSNMFHMLLHTRMCHIHIAIHLLMPFCHCLHYTSTHFRHWSSGLRYAIHTHKLAHSLPQLNSNSNCRIFSTHTKRERVSEMKQTPSISYYLQRAFYWICLLPTTAATTFDQANWLVAGACCIMPGHTFSNSIPA